MYTIKSPERKLFFPPVVKVVSTSPPVEGDESLTYLDYCLLFVAYFWSLDKNHYGSATGL